LRVLYFGTYERAYPRNAQVIACLRRTGVRVRELHASVWDRREHKWAAGPATAIRLAGAQARLLARRAPTDTDALIVGYPGHVDLAAARRAARGRPIVFNPLVSLADTLVSDRGRFRADSLPARVLRKIDRYALRAADLVVADTRENAVFFADLADLSPEQIEVCFVGAEERLFQPGWKPTAPFTCLFVGKLIPLHGIETILAAARLAPDLHLRLAGSGQLEPLLRRRPSNVEWVPWIDYDRLPGELHRASCALGVFGTSAKAARVIPNKAFQALACGTPLVTADTPAARELLADGESALLVPPGDPHALADALTALSESPELARRVGQGGLTAYRERASEEVLGVRWRALVERTLHA
jgi:glycosyltransferase involved in cell wall biosynthesis